MLEKVVLELGVGTGGRGNRGAEGRAGFVSGEAGERYEGKG